jgi:hypothetical protein
VASQSLLAELRPPTYDPRHDTQLTATTSFAEDFTQRLIEGTCVGNIQWRVQGWTMRWSDGGTDTLAGSGHDGITVQHRLAGDPRAGAEPHTADVTAIAHLNITGEAIDFDADGNLVVVTRSASVDISNKQSATGQGVAVVSYTPPQLAAGALPVSQLGDGSVPAVDLSAAPLTHANAIRGRLLVLYPRAIVIRPGTESIGGVIVGEARTTTTGWVYLGAATDAPQRDATPPGALGAPTEALRVQWNHAALLDASRAPVDELVPVQITVQSVYPDGHTETSSVTGNVAVTIYYIGLGFHG